MGSWRGVELTGVTLAEPGADGLRLRPYRPGDVPAEFAGLQDRSMHEFLPLPDPYTEADARAWCERIAPGRAESGEGLDLAMVGPDDVVVGSAGLRLPPPTRPTDGTGEIGYSVFAHARGRSLAARATRLLADWGFAVGVQRIEIHVAAGNLRSARAALRAGFRFEGLRRAGQATPAGVTDGAVFARLPGDGDGPVPSWLPALSDVHDAVIALRPVTADDATVLVEEMTDAESQRWAVGARPPDVVAAARSSARLSPLGHLVGPATRIAVTDRSAGTVVAVLELRRAGPPGVVEVGYSVLAPHRGRGIAARALGLLAGWLFDRTDLGRIELGAERENLASQRVAERAGFVCEGVAARRLAGPDGQYHDEVRYGLPRP